VFVCSNMTLLNLDMKYHQEGYCVCVCSNMTLLNLDMKYHQEGYCVCVVI